MEAGQPALRNCPCFFEPVYLLSGSLAHLLSPTSIFVSLTFSAPGYTVLTLTSPSPLSFHSRVSVRRQLVVSTPALFSSCLLTIH